MRVNISPMKIGEGQLFEIYLDASIRIICPPELIPAPGQYILAHASGSDSPLAVPVFFSDSTLNGFQPLVNIPLPMQADLTHRWLFLFSSVTQRRTDSAPRQ